MFVLLDSGTVGEVEAAAVGEVVTVKLHDENGNPITETRTVIEIL